MQTKLYKLRYVRHFRNDNGYRVKRLCRSAGAFLRINKVFRKDGEKWKKPIHWIFTGEVPDTRNLPKEKTPLRREPFHNAVLFRPYHGLHGIWFLGQQKSPNFLVPHLCEIRADLGSILYKRIPAAHQQLRSTVRQKKPPSAHLRKAAFILAR